ncbi:MAG: hypothetical protein OXE53_17020 [Deltaproteobacteria bacterium]|nr:hypothetical protein [Deltaproteobacteria bacterium]
MIGVFGKGWGRAADALRRFCLASRASVSLESVCCICFTVAIAASVFEVVKTLFIGDILHRAAQAVARDNSLQMQAAADREQLLARARKAVREEVDDWLDPDLLEVDVKVYDNPSTMLQGTESTGGNRLLGGDPGNMVVVRLRYAPETVLARLRERLQADETDSLAFQALAVARNERVVDLSPPPTESLQVTSRGG